MSRGQRSLWPREHGAYGQLGAPLLGALLVHTPTFATVALTAAACLAFLANEPLLVVLGQRGERLRAAQGLAARRRLAALLAGTVVLAIAGLARSSTTTLEVVAITALPGACLVGLAWSRRQHTIGGELLAAVTLPAAAAPVMVAAGIPAGAAIAVWAAWAIGYLCSVTAVHRVLARHRHRHPASWLDRSLVVGFVAVIAATLSSRIALIAAPLASVSLGLVVRPPRATRMRATGVVLVVASLASDVILLAVIA